MERLPFVQTNHLFIALTQVSELHFNIINAHSIILLNIVHKLSTTYAVEPSQVASIFSLDRVTGTLTITARGPGLEPSGVDSGRIEV